METKKIDLIVWDLETTGFVAPESKILEIGALVVSDGVVEQKHWVLDNKCEIPANIIEITGITPEIIAAEGRDPIECLEEFLPLIHATERNVTHNGIKFDIPFLTAYASHVLEMSGQETSVLRAQLRGTAFDTAVHYKASQLHMQPFEGELYSDFAERVMSQKVFGLKFNLGLCCDQYQIDRTGVIQHRALGDVDLTMRLYQRMQHAPA